jgi:iron(III) transport system ATP-binding protein
MPELVVEDIHKHIGAFRILNGVSLSLNPGEVLSLLGHSGSGKTTILRCVAGLETPNRGRILIRDRPVFDATRGIELPPEERGLGMVFQSYALWPNKTVAENVAYGLKLRREPPAKASARIEQVIRKLGLSGMADRYPHQLSGGQQQRVALARAIVYEPPVLLLDEPLSNLDAKLREEARSWVRELILQTRISALYVTHDQVEAMAVSDRVVLLRGGAMEQQGTPEEIYGHPQTAMAAAFMGSSNRISGMVAAVEGNYARIDLAAGSIWGKRIAPVDVGAPVQGFARIERIGLFDRPERGRLACRLSHSLYLGERWEYSLAVDDLGWRAWGQKREEPGEKFIEVARDDLWLFEDGKRS